jgi:hypothetical protein
MEGGFDNVGGVTQFRLRFTLDDNNNNRADYMTYYSGNGTITVRPRLVIEYH